jgi:serine protease Do
MRGTAFLSLIFVCVLAAGDPADAQSQTSSRAATGLTEFSRSLQDLAERVSPTVVQIFVTGYTPPDAEQTATAEPVISRGMGSGVIVDPDGYIVTNAHVVDNATRLEVELPFAATGGDPGRSILRRRGRIVGAQLVATDRETDLAVLKVDARSLPVLAFGDSDTLRPGQIVLAFGSPRGLDMSVTMGVVSAVARQLRPEDPMIYLQTDAPINPGNSGGPLVDTEGRLVGINTMILSQSGGSEGIGFAAPSNIVRNVFTQIRKTGRVRRGEIGVNAQTITPLMAEALGLAVDTGVILGDVAPNGPAAAAGLRAGDIILALDGKRMENGRQFRVNLYSRNVGDVAAVDILRGDLKLTAKVQVVERESETSRLSDLVTPENTIRPLGILALELTPQIAAMIPGRRSDKGIVVARVSSDGPYSQQGRLQAGDIIFGLNGKPVTTIAELQAALGTLKPAQATVLQVERAGTLLFLAFRLERTP